MASRSGLVSILGNVLLAGAKFWAGIATGSTALMADAWHTLSDSLSSLILMAGILISRKPPDEEHPYGHGRAELLASLAIGFLLLVVAINFTAEGIAKIKNQELIIYSTLAKIVTLLSVLLKEGMAQYSMYVYRKTGFTSVKADGWHHRSDALSSLVILAGIYLSAYLWWMDSLLTFLVAILIIFTAIEIMKSAINPLMGTKPDQQLVTRVEKLARETIDLPANVHHIHIHHYGDHTEITFHIKLPGEMSLEQAHEQADKLEKAIREKLQMTPTIHIEPI